MSDDKLVALGRDIARSGKYLPRPPSHTADPAPQAAPPAAPPAAAPAAAGGAALLHDGPDGAELLDELRDTVTRYVVFADKHAPSAVALRIAATHVLPAFECAPRLVITSPQKRCAKSRLLDLVAAACHKPLVTVNASTPAIFRSIGADHPPTLILDEADTLWGSKKIAEQNEDLRALINAGHQRGRPALRCVGPLQIPTEFPTFSMAALAGIGSMPDTITDRAVNISLRRRAPGERVAQFRCRRDGPILEKLRERLADWASWHLEALADAEPDMPVEDRAADTWEPLVAVADAAGGHWPRTARAACWALVSAAEDADDDRSMGTKLLADIAEIYAETCQPFIASNALVGELRKRETSAWGEFDLTASKLAYRLREFGIKPGHDTTGRSRGYRLEDFTDAFKRYTRQNPSSRQETGIDQQHQSDGSNTSDGLRCQTVSTRQTEILAQTLFPDGLTGSDGGGAGNMPADPTDEHDVAVATAMAGLNGHILEDRTSKPQTDE